MLFEFFMNFLNIEKKNLFSIFHVFLAFRAISNIKKKIGVKKKFRRYTCREFEHEVNWKVVSPDSR